MRCDRRVNAARLPSPADEAKSVSDSTFDGQILKRETVGMARQIGRYLAVSFILYAAFLTPAVSSADKPAVEDILVEPLIDQTTLLGELREFVKLRVIRMPKVKTAAEWQTIASRMRRDMLEKVVLAGEAAKWKDTPLNFVQDGKIEDGHGYHIQKLRFEAVPGLWIPALLYVPDGLGDRKAPVVMNVNGHDGQGKVAPYKQMRCINQAKRGMLALNVEWLGMGQLKGAGYVHYCMNQLDLCGTSGLAPFYLSMSRGLDVLLRHKNADPSRVAVAGLSGGGWQTIVISSLDERVTLADPVAGYSGLLTRLDNFSDLGDSEQTPVDMAITADYLHLTAMRAPRPTLLTYNISDNCCFASGHALPPLLEAARPVYRLFGKQDNLASHVNYDPGTHNFEKDNRQAFYNMLGVHFFNGQRFSPVEIDSKKELKTHEELLIALPEDNANFNTLARLLSKNLPMRSVKPQQENEQEAWRKQQREKLASIVRASDYKVVKSKQHSSTDVDGGTIRRWLLNLSETWTVPVIELVPKKPSEGVTVRFDDINGKEQAKAIAAHAFEAGQHTFLISPFYFGKSKFERRDFLLALLVSTVGERPLGVQASQFRAIIDWIAKEHSEPIDVVSEGIRHSMIVLVANALGASDQLKLHTMTTGVQSLRQIIEMNKTVQHAPELFCHGLLKEFDIEQIKQISTVKVQQILNPKADFRSNR